MPSSLGGHFCFYFSFLPQSPVTIVPKSPPAEPASLRETAESLIETEGGPWASLYMPADRARNRIQLRNLLGQLRTDAPLVGLEADAVDALLDPAEDLLADASLSESQEGGVALFLTPDAEEDLLIELPFAPPLSARIDERVHLRPLWRGIEPDGRFYILSLWGGGAKLHRASRHGMKVIPPKDGSNALDAVLWSDSMTRRAWNTPKTFPTSSVLPTRHPSGHWSQDDIRRNGPIQDGLLRFFRRVDDRLRPLFGRESTPPPLVLAGPKELRRLYREANGYRQLVEEGIEDSVRISGPKALHHRGWELVHPHFDKDRKRAHEQFSDRPSKAAANPGSVLMAAVEGRVDTLFVAEEPSVWGGFDVDSHSVHVHSPRESGDTELLNEATIATLQGGGTVYVGDPQAVPGGSSIAALLRY